jgi:osmotically-inducible protein OsmY
MSNDIEIRNAVLAELAWEPRLDAAHIGVTANAGIVALSGHVETYAQKHAATEAAWRVRGVTAVAEEIEIRLPFAMKRSDEEIAAAAIDRLAWDVTVPKDAIRVEIEDGWITLSGEVIWAYQKVDAEANVRFLLGVLGVSNHITIKPRVDTSNVADDIVHALHRSWFFDPKTIAVSADAGEHDRRLAASIAWAAPGATSVTNDIAVV